MMRERDLQKKKEEKKLPKNEREMEAQLKEIKREMAVNRRVNRLLGTGRRNK